MPAHGPVSERDRDESELPRGQNRRAFVTQSVGLAAVVAGIGGKSSVVPGAVTRAEGGLQAAEITEETIAEAEKLSALDLTVPQRRALVATSKAQVRNIQALRGVPKPRELQPALIFDPRLPGHVYPPQQNRVRLAPQARESLPSNDADIAYASVTSLAQWIRSRQLTSERLTNIYLSRIERIAPQLFCYITVTRDRALAEARTMDRELAAGRYHGPLHGIPYALKDVFDTAGVRTTWGSAVFKDRIPDEDATIVEMLRKAGAVLLGKAATAELANGSTWFGGNCRNPWNPDEPSGGSSAGPGSATAAGLCGFAIGTDSLGSILNPADRCGVVGLRPTFGRVPVKGGMPLTPSLERIGPICRRVEDAALVLAVINGADPTSAASIDMGFSYDANIDIRKLKVGYSPGWFEEVGFATGTSSKPRGSGAAVSPGSAPASAAHHHALDALRTLGVQLVPLDIPALPYQVMIGNLYVEAAAVFEDLTLTHGDEGLLPGNGWSNGWRQAHLFSAVDYLQNERFRRQVMREMATVFGRVDALFGPTYGSFDLFLTMNFTGHPGVTLRAGFAKSPTRTLAPAPTDPKGPAHTITQNVAFHGRLFEEGKILALARALEAKLDVWRERPPVG